MLPEAPKVLGKQPRTDVDRNFFILFVFKRAFCSVPSSRSGTIRFTYCLKQKQSIHIRAFVNCVNPAHLPDIHATLHNDS